MQEHYFLKDRPLEPTCDSSPDLKILRVGYPLTSKRPQVSLPGFSKSKKKKEQN